MTPQNAMLIAAAGKAVPPWRSNDASAFADARIRLPDFQNDDQRTINMCLNCPFEGECVDCIDAWKELRFIRYTKKKRSKKR